MATIMNMPKLGLTMSEGTIEKWLHREGDRVEKGAPLVELTTDKSLIEHEAAQSGILVKILVAEGETVTCGKAICIIAEEAEDIAALLEELDAPATGPSPQAPAASRPEAPPAAPAPAPSEDAPFVKASPAARKKARELGVDLRLLTGTGPGGRIVEKDVVPAAAPAKATPTAAAIMAGTGAVPARPVATGERIHAGDLAAAETREPLSPVQRQIAARMTASKQAVPHWYVKAHVDCTALIAMRSRLLPGIERRYGARLSYNHLLMKALACTLAAHPRCNGSFREDHLVLHSQVNVGLAVAAGEDLLVPVVRDVGALTLGEVAAETSRLIEKARSGRLLPMDYEEGTVTISNLGMYQIDSFIPIINPPEGGILGVGAMRELPVALDGEIVIRPVMDLWFSADHRIIHGALGAKFLEDYKTLLEHPEEALI